MVDQGLPGNPPREAAVIQRRGILRALGAGPLAATLPELLSATPLSKVKSRGSLVVGLYKDMPPFHADGGGIDVELGRALAESLGVAFSPLPFCGAPLPTAMRNDVAHSLLRPPMDRGRTGHSPVRCEAFPVGRERPIRFRRASRGAAFPLVRTG